MTKKERILKYAQDKNIELTEEQQRKIDSIEELTDEELDAVSGGCCTIPDAPTCPNCWSHNTYTKNFPDMKGYCRVCGHEWELFWNDYN